MNAAERTEMRARGKGHARRGPSLARSDGETADHLRRSHAASQPPRTIARHAVAAGGDERRSAYGTHVAPFHRRSDRVFGNHESPPR